MAHTPLNGSTEYGSMSGDGKLSDSDNIDSRDACVCRSIEEAVSMLQSARLSTLHPIECFHQLDGSPLPHRSVIVLLDYMSTAEEESCTWG